MDRDIGQLSGGELQRFAIAMCCVQKADVYVVFLSSKLILNALFQKFLVISKKFPVKSVICSLLNSFSYMFDEPVELFGRETASEGSQSDSRFGQGR